MPETMIARNRYLDQLIAKQGNGLVKVITGIRRCGKSVLLLNLYHAYLNDQGVPEGDIIELALDEATNARYRNPLELDAFVRSRVADASRQHYVFLDEIQKVANVPNPYLDDPSETIGFTDVLLGLMKLPNVDLYVTGSNSRMLSSDILTEFKDRGDEIRVRPLTYAEFCSGYPGERRHAWRDFYTYGGMPHILALKTHEEKSRYLKGLFEKTYVTDVLERNRILNDRAVLEELLNIVSSSVGSLTNPSKLSRVFKSVEHVNINPSTISDYLDCFVDAFVMEKAHRFDVKGKRYIHTPLKYYFTDVGLRNARLNFRQQEENHIMENVLYNELSARGFDIDVGVVEHNYKDKEGKSKRSQLEVDFVCNKGGQRMYVQSALTVADEEKRRQETESLRRVPDSFKKIVVVKDDIVPWHDEDGIFYVCVEDFLLKEELMRP